MQNPKTVVGGSKRHVIRAGRPSAANAKNVGLRLLEATTHLIRVAVSSFKAISCDYVALASAGKGSIYARYANKEELFTAVVRRSVASLYSSTTVPLTFH